MSFSEPLLTNQAEVEQSTGLSREVLRKWELRFGFPLPQRGGRGQRVYSEGDVGKLQLISQLMARGMRPGQLVQLSIPDLHNLLRDSVMSTAELEPAVQELLACLAPGAASGAIETYLGGVIEKVGLRQFIYSELPRFNSAIGGLWAGGHLGISAEHRYTETVRTLVNVALVGLLVSREKNRVLVTTPPGELHVLAILALRAALILQGADCISLGPQTPAPDVVQAVKDWDVEVVAISISAFFNADKALTYVAVLRRLLPPHCRLWLGGEGGHLLAGKVGPQVEFFDSVNAATQAWCRLAGVSVD